MIDWKEYKLEQITEPVKETYLPNTNEEIPYIGLEHIEPESLRLNSIGNSSDVTSNKFKFYANDILFGKLRPYFRKVIKPQFDGICSTDIWVFRAKENINQNFLFYFIANWDFVDTANGADTGTRMPRADWDYLKYTIWEIPKEQEQIQIANILISLDDKIDLLNRQNKTLEALAETLFRQWFIEEADENWEVGKLEDEFTFIMGQSPLGEFINENEEGMVFYQGNADFNFRFPSVRVYTTESKRIAKQFDTLVSVRAPVGDINMAFEECCLGRGVAAFKYKTVPKYYSYTYYKMRSLMQQVKLFEDSGTVFGSIGKNDFRNLKNTIPPQDIVDNFNTFAEPIDKKIYQNELHIRTLTLLRDKLLPKLMSGEVRVET